MQEQQDLAHKAQTAEGDTASEVRGQTPRVLVIDDESINVMVLRGMLQAAGFETLSAEDGPTGRELAAREQPDIILLDIMMPMENGFDTCHRLKQDPRCTDIPIIFISALSDVDNKVRGLETGAVDYITKPFEKAEVMARIRLHLKLRLAQNAIIESQAARLQQIAEAQKSILVQPEDYPEARFAIKYVPILEAGGDFYDVFPTGAKSFCFFAADISGHDLGASFVTSSLKALVRQNSGPLYTPTETMKNINSVLKTILKDGKYLTAQACYLHRGLAQLTVLNAGHPPAIYVDNAGQAEFLQADGDILGAFDTVCLEPITRRVKKGDRFYLYTDGLTERFDSDKQSRTLGEEALLALCQDCQNLPLDRAVETIVDNIVGQQAAQEDDLVLMGVEV